MNQVLQKLLDSGFPMDFQPAAAPRDIEAFERRMGVRLPAAYREWLTFSDGGEILVPGTQFYGIHGDGGDTLHARNAAAHRGRFSLPESLYIVGRTNFGDILCMDLAGGELVQWDHETDEEFMRWDSLFAYMDEGLRSYSEDS